MMYIMALEPHCTQSVSRVRCLHFARYPCLGKTGVGHSGLVEGRP